jgi:hypothetical protein
MVSRFNFPAMKIVPALAILAIVWILAHATVREFLVTELCWCSRRFSILRVRSFAGKRRQRQKPISFPPCAIIISRSIIRFLRFPSVSTDDKHKENLVECGNLAGQQAQQDRSANAACTNETSSIVWARNEHRPGRPTV